MRINHWTAACLLALSLTGCPGEITDPESFVGYNDVAEPKEDAGKASDASNGDNKVDAGSPPKADAGAKDAGGGGASDAGGTGSGGGADAAAPLPSCDFTALMASKCGSSSCHGAPALGTGLDLTSANLATRMEGRQGTNGCADYKMVDKDNPAQSALYLIVTNKPCGVRMPIGAAMSDAEQACVLSWIENL